MHLLGPPKDEATRETYRVDQPSLLRHLAAMNYVHPQNDPAAFDNFRHYIFFGVPPIE